MDCNKFSTSVLCQNPQGDPDTLSLALAYPTQAPPEGVTANFINPDSISYQLYITTGVCISLIVVFALMKLLSKIYVGPKTVGIDESTSLSLFPRVTVYRTDKSPRSRLHCRIGRPSTGQCSL